MVVDVIKTGSIGARNPLFIVGFPGVGLVGSVATSFFVEKGGFEMVGYISSNEFAPLAAIHNYAPLPPVRIYFSKEKNIVVVLSEIVVPVATSNELAAKILEFAKELKSDRIISLGGISLKEAENSVYLVGSNKKEVDSLTSSRIAKSIKEGATTGVTGTLLAIGSITGYSILAVLGEANPDFVDPKAASNVLRVLSKIISMPINTAELDREARTLSQGAKESAIKSKSITKKSEPPGGMYG
ncbi:PAC2 family protein [Candidatus Micrarchaeota archaeon]|nr:PAC2 family protein [Candidatus Micrarchaeota archaeon]